MTAKKNYELIDKYPNRVMIDYKHLVSYRECHEYLEVSFDREFHYRIQTNPDDPLARWTSKEYAAYSIPVEAIDIAEKRVKQLLKQQTANIKAGKLTAQYNAILEICNETGWPTHYKTDLDHDAECIALHNPDKFLFAIRECGTWLFISNDSQSWREAVVNVHNSKENYYLIDNCKIRQLSASEFSGYQFN